MSTRPNSILPLLKATPVIFFSNLTYKNFFFNILYRLSIVALLYFLCIYFALDGIQLIIPRICILIIVGQILLLYLFIKHNDVIINYINNGNLKQVLIIHVLLIAISILFYTIICYIILTNINYLFFIIMLTPLNTSLLDHILLGSNVGNGGPGYGPGFGGYGGPFGDPSGGGGPGPGGPSGGGGPNGPSGAEVYPATRRQDDSNFAALEAKLDAEAMDSVLYKVRKQREWASRHNISKHKYSSIYSNCYPQNLQLTLYERCALHQHLIGLNKGYYYGGNIISPSSGPGERIIDYDIRMFIRKNQIKPVRALLYDIRIFWRK